MGVDFSPRMLDLARRLTAATGAPATWVEADVLAVPHELDGTADLLYTGTWRDHLAPGPRPLGRDACAGSSPRTGAS